MKRADCWPQSEPRTLFSIKHPLIMILLVQSYVWSKAKSYHFHVAFRKKTCPLTNVESFILSTQQYSPSPEALCPRLWGCSSKQNKQPNTAAHGQGADSLAERGRHWSQRHTNNGEITPLVSWIGSGTWCDESRQINRRGCFTITPQGQTKLALKFKFGKISFHVLLLGKLICQQVLWPCCVTQCWTWHWCSTCLCWR